MNCPNCKTGVLAQKEIERNLSALSCPECEGNWISHRNYESWLASQEENLPELAARDDSERSIPQFELARVCPVCRRILIKYRIGHSIPFTIDRCSDCGGIWLDKNEWETLKSRGLHDELPEIFTDYWQEEVHREETRRKLVAIYKEKFGEEDYARIMDFKTWIDQHEKRGEILAYLNDQNPLQF